MPIKLFREFLNSEKAGGFILCVCAIISMTLANSTLSVSYQGLWKTTIAGSPVDHWINDGLMAIFFLLIGLELKREIYTGELSSAKKAGLPIFAALGGMLLPAAIHYSINHGTPSQAGAGIPMATDIAFALGILSLAGNRIPVTVRIFLTALAVIDDLGAIFVIGLFYSKTISFVYLSGALGTFLLLVVCNRFKVRKIVPYLLGGVLMWYFMLHSGVHASITGVLLAITIPFTPEKSSPASLLEHLLMKPVAFVILPIFAFANTAISINGSIAESLFSRNSLGIFMGLVLGKPVGIFFFSWLAVKTGICAKPANSNWLMLAGVSILGGIGFTMAIFITLLAFDADMVIASSKISIIAASVISAVAGIVLLNIARATEKN